MCGQLIFIPKIGDNVIKLSILKIDQHANSIHCNYQLFFTYQISFLTDLGSLPQFADLFDIEYLGLSGNQFSGILFILLPTLMILWL